MKKKIDTLLSIMIILVLFPLLVTLFFQRSSPKTLIEGMENDFGENRSGTQGGEMGEEETERQVLGIVAKEIRADSSKEAILAQTVIARTNLYAARKAKTKEPESLEPNEMRELWGEEFEAIYQRLKECVEETRGQVLTWNGAYIYAAYHAMSAGETRNMAELYGESNMPYLTNVVCPEDNIAEGYITVSYWEKDAFFPKDLAEEKRQAMVTKRDAAGYVLEVQIGDELCAGEDFRSRYGLNSACFSIAETDGKIRIVTKGLGHGFGLSQYTAEHMAEEGKNYKEILQFFYPGTELAV
ncbi:MAG: SpoIID/LytB domain-containing protein [Clostridiales bacterium]|nr:SpoIID/LytB domain-containing protein [Clostridiales bacterium]